MPLTKRQKEALDFVAGFVSRRGYSPSFEEIADGLGLASIATVHKHLTALTEKGYLRRSFNQSRALEVTDKYRREQVRQRRDAERLQGEAPSLETPLLGAIAAGRPIESYENRESVSFADYLGAKNVFALEVRGDSMIDDHIVEGDFVLVEQTDRVRDGDIVVALVDSAETTLKRFYREGDFVRLQPANREMAPIRAHAAAVQIQGRVLAVHRKYR